MIRYIEGSIDSSGYAKDLAVLSLAYGLLKASSDIEENGLESYEGLEETDTLDFDEGIREMVMGETKSLREEIKIFMERDEHRDIYEKVKRKSEKLMREGMKIIQSEVISLEVLAMYVLYENFINERAKPLHIDYKPLNTIERYTIVIDALNASGYALRSQIQMKKIAREIVNLS